MTEWNRGLKAGLIAGAIWAIINAIETALQTFSPSTMIIVVAILRIAWGLILGLIFALAVEGFMPTRSYRVKGAIFGLAIGTVEVAANLLPMLFGIAFSPLNMSVGIASALVFGGVLGYSYEKLARRTV